VTGSRAVDLHDPASLLASDPAGLLPSAALAGAQVRSSADQLAAWSDFDRPRALVVVGAGAAVDAALLVALIGDNAIAPVVAAATLPGWVGALDIVIVFASAIDDLAAAEAAATAARRGARVVVRAAAQGPVAAAAGPALLDPQVAVTEALAATARLTVLAAVAASAGLYPRPDFAAAADQLDAMAMACHPSSEFFVNPALTLAEHLSTGTPLLIGTDPVADALATHACRSLAGLAGCAAASLGSGQAAGSPPVLARATGRGGAGSGDPFWDPYEDTDDPGQQISTVLVVGPSGHSAAGPLTGSGLLPVEAVAFGAGPTGVGRSALAAALESALPRALCIGPEELPERVAADPGPGPVPPAMQRDAFTWTVAMLSRIDFAAVYLGLTAAARPPVDSPDGLGRRGQSAQYLPSTGGPSAWNERGPGSWS
jgi:hypothetical protein